MGRGRAKAKQVKVARQLKYSGGGTDLDRLRAELGVDTELHGADERSAHADLGGPFSGDDEDSDNSLDDDDSDDEDWADERSLGDYGDENLIQRPQPVRRGMTAAS